MKVQANINLAHHKNGLLNQFDNFPHVDFRLGNGVVTFIKNFPQASQRPNSIKQALLYIHKASIYL